MSGKLEERIKNLEYTLGANIESEKYEKERMKTRKADHKKQITFLRKYRKKIRKELSEAKKELKKQKGKKRRKKK